MMLPERNKTRLEKAVSKWERVMKANGKKILKLRTLINSAGYKKRGAKNFNSIKGYLRGKGLYLTAPLDGYKCLEETRLDGFVHIYPYPAGPKGGLFEKEDDLQAAFRQGNIHPKLGLASIIKKEYKPAGSTKRLDI